jgi:hypothetical protein
MVDVLYSVLFVLRQHLRATVARNRSVWLHAEGGGAGKLVLFLFSPIEHLIYCGPTPGQAIYNLMTRVENKP